MGWGYREKTLTLWGFTEKLIFRGFYEKPIYWGGGDLPKRGTWRVCRLKRGLGQKKEWCFLRVVNTSMHTMGKVREMGDFKKWEEDLNNVKMILK